MITTLWEKSLFKWLNREVVPPKITQSQMRAIARHFTRQKGAGESKNIPCFEVQQVYIYWLLASGKYWKEESKADPHLRYPEQSRCRWVSAVTGRQCKNRIGTDLGPTNFCGRHQKMAGGSENLMSRRAKYALSPASKLKDALIRKREAEEAGREFDLSEDLHLFECTAEDAIRYYDAACASGQLDLAMAAGSVLRDVLNEVAEMTLKAQKVRKTALEMFSVEDIPGLLAQIEFLAKEHFAPLIGGSQLAESFLEFVYSRLTITDGTGMGTNKTPDQLAIEMSETVPSAPENVVDHVNTN